jgi:hypothetical protein
MRNMADACREEMRGHCTSALPATGTIGGGSFGTLDFFEEALRHTNEAERRDKL